MFEKASRLKLRFESKRGDLTVEDLWEIPLARGQVNLDDIAKSLHRALKQTEEESFVNKTNRKDATLQLSFDIVKHIIDVRLAEKEELSKAADKKAQKEQIANLIARKKDEEMQGMPLEKLQEMYDSL